MKAKDSARAKMMQFTTIRGMYMPSALDRSGRNAFSSRSTMVTKEAITTMKDGMRTFSGMT